MVCLVFSFTLQSVPPRLYKADRCHSLLHKILPAYMKTKELVWRLQNVTNNASPKENRDSSVGIALDYWLDIRDSRVWFLAGAENFCLHHRVQNGSGAHLASYPMSTRGSFLVGKAAGAWSWPPSSAEVEECMELCLHSSKTPSWCGAQLKRSTGTTLPLPLALPLPLPLLVTAVINDGIAS
jgi:hypothetical protein